VAPPLGGQRTRLLSALAAAGAVLFIAAMAFTGGRREPQQLVRFRAAGVLEATPQQIDRVDVERDGRRVSFLRSPDGRWTDDDGAGRPVARVAGEHLDMSLKFMHVTEPVRVMERPEWDGTPDSEFGLDPPRYAVRMSVHGTPVLRARFGGTNPQRVSQYARIDGRDQLYLLPTFVGVEWERVWESSAR
jgi:hypothetical protein